MWLFVYSLCLLRFSLSFPSLRPSLECTNQLLSDTLTSPSSITASIMSQFTAHEKHIILSEYRPRSPTHSFAALAARHGIVGGKRTVQRWHQRWKKNPVSLEHRKGAGRPRVLSKLQVTRHVVPPIRNANRAARAIRYPQLLPRVQAATGTDVSLSTLKRYAKEEKGAKMTRGKKRTADECKYAYTCEICNARMMIDY
jgi:hypothetical protein